MRDLTLYTISNATYDTSLLCAIEQEEENPEVAAQLFVSVVSCSATRYETDNPLTKFKAVDILLAAIETADYMRDRFRGKPLDKSIFEYHDAQATTGDESGQPTVPS